MHDFKFSPLKALQPLLQYGFTPCPILIVPCPHLFIPDLLDPARQRGRPPHLHSHVVRVGAQALVEVRPGVQPSELDVAVAFAVPDRVLLAGGGGSGSAPGGFGQGKGAVLVVGVRQFGRVGRAWNEL